MGLGPRDQDRGVLGGWGGAGCGVETWGSRRLGDVGSQGVGVGLGRGVLGGRGHGVGGGVVVWNPALWGRGCWSRCGCPQVQEFGWPDLLAPPLDTLCAICKALERCLRALPPRVAVLHCRVCGVGVPGSRHRGEGSWGRGVVWGWGPVVGSGVFVGLGGL